MRKLLAIIAVALALGACAHRQEEPKDITPGCTRVDAFMFHMVKCDGQPHG